MGKEGKPEQMVFQHPSKENNGKTEQEGDQREEDR